MITHEELMAYIDGELPPERARAVEAELETSTELRREHALFSRMKSDLQELGSDMRMDPTVWTGVSRRIARPLGWVVFLIGLGVWLAYGIYSYLTGADAMWEKLATSAVVIGLGMLLLSAIIDRVHDLKTDPYRHIHQ